MIISVRNPEPALPSHLAIGLVLRQLRQVSHPSAAEIHANARSQMMLTSMLCLLIFGRGSKSGAEPGGSFFPNIWPRVIYHQNK